MKKLLLAIILSGSYCILYANSLNYNKSTDTTKVKYISDAELDLEKEADLFVKNVPSFGLYKDNYFITGIPTGGRIDKNTANAKYQISIRQLLFKKVLPRNHILALTYTQKSFWDIYKKSAPFTDNNYNPGIATLRPIVHRGEVKGLFILGFEHESNGLDSINSRSWNYFVISTSYIINSTLSVQVKLCPGWIDKEANPDLYKYKGYGLLAINYVSPNQRFLATGVITPIDRFRSFNTQLDFNYRFSKKTNQYTFLQWYQGYGEGLLNYNRYTSMIRIGICIKSQSRF